MFTNLKCFPCDEVLTRRETFYFYQCQSCFQKTSYCLRCNTTMDCLLNGVLFKCCVCKVLTKIIQRETVSPEQNRHNNQIGRNDNNEMRSLFHNNMNLENDTPIKSLFAREEINVNRINLNHPQMNNFNIQVPIHQNLMQNFDQTENHRFESLLQTPITVSRVERNLQFSPEDNHILQTPQTTRNKTENVINLNNLGFSTPRNIHKNNSQRTGSINRNIMDESITVDEFENKLLIDSNSKDYKMNKMHNYSILANKNNRIARIMSGKPDIHNISINRGNANNLLVESKKTSIFAGYNKTESSIRRNVSKSPLSLRKRKPNLTLNEQNMSAFTNNSNIQQNFNNSGILNNPLPNFGCHSQLSDIKPINNYNNTMDQTKFSFTNYSTENNLSRFSNI